MAFRPGWFPIIVLLASSCAGDSDSSRIHLAYVTNGVTSFWQIARAGAEHAARDFDVSVTVQMPVEGISDQKRMVQDLLTVGVDGIAISPIDPANQKDLVDEAAANTIVITQDSDAPGTNRLCYIGMDNYLAGRMCGELVKEAIPLGGKVAILVGRLEQDNARRRRQGVIDELLDRAGDPDRYDPHGAELAGERYSVVATLTDQYDRAKAKANAEDLLSRFPDLAAMVGLFAYNGPLSLEVLKQAGRVGEVQIIGFDEADQTLQAIRDGAIFGTIVQDPYRYGYESIRVLAALARGDRSVLPAEGFLNIPARQIRADNVAGFWTDLKAKLEGR